MLLKRFGFVLCIGLAVAWQNDWDSVLSKYCSPGDSFVRVRSIHSNSYEDRRYQFDCGGQAKVSNICYDTGYVNDWDNVMDFRCNHNYVVNGVYSYHDNVKEDRRFKFRCCQLESSTQENCVWTSYRHNWEMSMDYTVPSGSVIRGFYSTHRNDKEDRRWKVYVCTLSQ